MKLAGILSWIKKESKTAVSDETVRVLDRVSEKITGISAKEEVNRNRRRLLSAFVLGSGAILLGNSLKSASDFIAGNTTIDEKMFKNFIVRESGKTLSFFDRQSGEEILVIEK